MSLNQSNHTNSIRSKPEEVVRQKLLKYLIEQLNYPEGLIAVEVPIGSLCSTKIALKRRLDIVCYIKEGSRLKPFLLIECKAKKPTGRALTAAWSQLMGYNSLIQAPYLSLVWDTGMVCAATTGEYCALPCCP